MRLEEAPDVLKVAEVAQLLRVRKDAVYELIQRRELQAVRIGDSGRIIRVTRQALQAFLQGGGDDATP
jgi:excisionase family DNA binding protein